MQRTLPWATGLVFAAAMLAAPPAAADPMRPLAGGMPPATAPTPDTGSTTADQPAAEPVYRLLAIRQNNNGERVALFGDRWLRVGDSFAAPEGHTRVLAIGNTHVEWERDRVRSTQYLLMPLLPAQWPVQPASPPKSDTATTEARAPHHKSSPPAPARVAPPLTNPNPERK